MRKCMIATIDGVEYPALVMDRGNIDFIDRLLLVAMREGNLTQEHLTQAAFVRGDLRKMKHAASLTIVQEKDDDKS